MLRLPFVLGAGAWGSTKDDPQIIASLMTEAELLACVVDCAHLYGWLACHFRPAKTEKGWRTALQGDAGGPDTILARNGQILLVELKTEKGKLSPEQKEWQDAGVITWRPSQWLSGEIEKALR